MSGPFPIKRSTVEEVVKFKMQSDSALPPLRATEQAAGFDCKADLGHPEAKLGLRPGEQAMIHLGFAFEPPQGYAGFLYPRSGLGTKKGLVLANTVGIIDQDYRDELMACVRNNGTKDVVIEHGERICQLVIAPVFMGEAIQVEELSTTDRNGGFGSTGTK